MDRRSVLIDGFRELWSDLVAFQEPIKTDGYDQVIDLLGSDFHVVHHNAGLVGDGDHHGASIASRWPLGEVREVDLNVTPRTADFPCTTLIAEILAPDPIGPLLFVNHLPSYQLGFEVERELQAVAAARFVEERRRGPRSPGAESRGFLLIAQQAAPDCFGRTAAKDGLCLTGLREHLSGELRRKPLARSLVSRARARSS